MPDLAFVVPWTAGGLRRSSPLARHNAETDGFTARQLRAEIARLIEAGEIRVRKRREGDYV